ncbi:unnamed protein product [Arctia plantaginis]|uniref:Uncharacterized protein n=1 Tax=Arctia plantaginis TaxID=874455 RepID=A0A8S0YRQ8_ARCPL|nr:unnamed protein product [Arctia plantaginis]
MVEFWKDWNTAGSSSQPTVAPPLPASEVKEDKLEIPSRLDTPLPYQRDHRKRFEFQEKFLVGRVQRWIYSSY